MGLSIKKPPTEAGGKLKYSIKKALLYYRVASFEKRWQLLKNYFPTTVYRTLFPDVTSS